MSDIAKRLTELEAGVGEFIAENASARTPEDLAERYGDDPLGFVREVLKLDLWEGQERIVNAVHKEPRVAVFSNNSLGKGFAVAPLALWWVLCRGGFAVLTATTERTVRQALMRYVRRAFYAGNLPGQLFEFSLRLDGEDRLLAFTSNAADRITGIHDPRLMVIIDEAQGVEDHVFEGVHALVTSEQSKIVLLGNPLRPHGKFYEACTGGRWHAIGLSAFDHPNVIEGREIYEGAVTRQWIDHMAQEYGEDSPIYIARVLGQFPSTSIDGLVERAWLDRAADHFEARSFEREARGHRLVLALDVARYGVDATSLATVQGPIVRSLDSWRDSDLVSTARRFQRAGEEATPYGGKRPVMIVDAHGIGGGVVDNLRDWGWTVQEFWGWNPANNSQRYLNKRAESYFVLRERLRAGKIALPRNEALFQELIATTWFLNSRGQIQLEAKDDIKAGLGRSPDLADAVTMGVHHNAHRRRAGVIPWRV